MVQAVQLPRSVAPCAPEYLPAGQFVQEEAPVVLMYVAVGHKRHAVMTELPVLLLKVPFRQGVGAELPVGQ